MKSYPITIFLKLPFHKVKHLKSKKINYWLEKSAKQEEEKKSTISQEVSHSEKKGFDDAVRSHAEKEEADRLTLDSIVTNSNRILLKISSVFPWDFFPTTICLEDTRITIIYRQLFSSQVYSVDIKDISNVLLENSFVFSTIIIISKTFVQNDIRIGSLWKKDAILIRRLIEGLRVFTKHELNTSTYKIEELIVKLKELSTTKMII
jgi:hypothetical protein